MLRSINLFHLYFIIKLIYMNQIIIPLTYSIHFYLDYFKIRVIIK